jgi:hypothetical protein
MVQSVNPFQNSNERNGIPFLDTLDEGVSGLGIHDAAQVYPFFPAAGGEKRLFPFGCPLGCNSGIERDSRLVVEKTQFLIAWFLKFFLPRRQIAFVLPGQHSGIFGVLSGG